jgi:hypothetical protein
MTLINTGASFPSYMWAVTRLLLASGGTAEVTSARLLLTPPSLPAGDSNDEFDVAVKTLLELGFVTVTDGTAELTSPVRALSIDDVTGFNAQLRTSVLDPARNEGLATNPDLGGPKDLVRALSWFLRQDVNNPVGWTEIEQLQADAFPPPLPLPFADNSSRWNRFIYWGPALGLAAPPLRAESIAARLVPDCTVAVRETMLSLWKEGQSVRPGEVLARVLAELPVLPGGRYSRSLGLAAPEDAVSPSLSNALLTGHQVGWITLDQKSDAADVIFLLDADGTRVAVSNVMINGGE